MGIGVVVDGGRIDLKMSSRQRRRSSATGCIDEVARVEDNGEPTPEERVPEES
jgi:hypothetical protein